jgi:hypothetical protein
VDQVNGPYRQRYEYETNDRIAHLVSVIEPDAGGRSFGSSGGDTIIRYAASYGDYVVLG